MLIPSHPSLSPSPNQLRPPAVLSAPPPPTTTTTISNNTYEPFKHLRPQLLHNTSNTNTNNYTAPPSNSNNYNIPLPPSLPAAAWGTTTSLPNTKTAPPTTASKQPPATQSTSLLLFGPLPNKDDEYIQLNNQLERLLHISFHKYLIDSTTSTDNSTPSTTLHLIQCLHKIDTLIVSLAINSSIDNPAAALLLYINTPVKLTESALSAHNRWQRAGSSTNSNNRTASNSSSPSLRITLPGAVSAGTVTPVALVMWAVGCMLSDTDDTDNSDGDSDTSSSSSTHLFLPFALSIFSHLHSLTQLPPPTILALTNTNREMSEKAKRASVLVMDQLLDAVLAHSMISIVLGSMRLLKSLINNSNKNNNKDENKRADEENSDDEDDDSNNDTENTDPVESSSSHHISSELRGLLYLRRCYFQFLFNVLNMTQSYMKVKPGAAARVERLLQQYIGREGKSLRWLTNYIDDILLPATNNTNNNINNNAAYLYCNCMNCPSVTHCKCKMDTTHCVLSHQQRLLLYSLLSSLTCSSLSVRRLLRTDPPKCLLLNMMNEKNVKVYTCHKKEWQMIRTIVACLQCMKY